MSCWEVHHCPDLCQSSNHIIKDWQNEREGFSPMVEKEICVKLIFIDFYISIVLLGFLCHSEEFMMLPQHCICCLLQPCKIILLGCKVFLPWGSLQCSYFPFLDHKKCSLQPLGRLSTKSVFMRAESMAELQVSLCISQPTEQKGTCCPPMDGWLTGMLLSPVLPCALGVVVPGNQNPPHPGLCQAALTGVPGNAGLETRFACLQGKPLAL